MVLSWKIGRDAQVTRPIRLRRGVQTGKDPSTPVRKRRDLLGAMALLLAAVSPALFVQALQALDLSARDFGPSAPFREFWGTQPLGAHITPPVSASADGTNNSALGCGTPPLGRCMFSSGDEWLRKTLPMFPAAAGKGGLTLPFTHNLSAVRMLGGLTTGGQGQPLGTVPFPELDLVHRDPATGALVNNFTRMDTTLDVFVANVITPSLLVLDNIPFAFVRRENRLFGGFGLGSAPDNTTEFAAWIGELAQHLVERYGMAEVSRWRFRLGTEADGPRMGPRWAAPDGNGVIGMPTAGGAMKNFSHGLDQYVETYLAVGFALKKVIPDAAFGPSNFAGQGGPEGLTASAGGGNGHAAGVGAGAQGELRVAGRVCAARLRGARTV